MEPEILTTLIGASRDGPWPDANRDAARGAERSKWSAKINQCRVLRDV